MTSLSLFNCIPNLLARLFYDLDGVLQSPSFKIGHRGPQHGAEKAATRDLVKVAAGEFPNFCS